MLEEASLLALMQGKSKDGGVEIRRISLDESTRVNVMEMLAASAYDLTYCEDGSRKTPQPFHADYTAQPEADEYIEINPYELPEIIREAISHPLPLETYIPDKSNLPLIRALFAGEKRGDDYFAVFQRFKSAQYLKASSIHLQYSSNTLTAPGTSIWEKWSGKVGLTVMPVVDAVCANGALQFVSAYYAKQVLDLTEYYVEASKPELEDFVSLDALIVEDPDYLINSSNTWEKRKIASIRNARIIEEPPLDEMLGHAKDIGYDLPVSIGKLTIPADKTERRKLLAFLDEDVYRGMFTDSIYQTNSKRAV